MPLNAAAYDLTRKQGFYAANPGHEIAVRQLLTRGTPNWKSLRLAHHPRLRSIIDEEIDLAWQGQKGSAEALNAAVRRGNAFLRAQQIKKGPGTCGPGLGTNGNLLAVADGVSQSSRSWSRPLWRCLSWSRSLCLRLTGITFSHPSPWNCLPPMVPVILPF